MLTTDDAEQARSIAAVLDSCNTRRQEVERQILDEARAMIEAEGGLGDRRSIVLAREGWHAGVIGIVASRLADMFHRPADRDLARRRRSPRALPARFPASTSTRRSRHAPSICSPSAAIPPRPGSSSGKTSSPISPAASRKTAAPPCEADQLERELTIDAEVPLGVLTLRVVEEIERLEPHGIANPRPLLLASDLEIAGIPREVGAQKQHLQLRFKQGAHELKAIGWNMASPERRSLTPGTRCSVVFHPSINEWNHRRDVQLEIRDIAMAEHE